MPRQQLARVTAVCLATAIVVTVMSHVLWQILIAPSTNEMELLRKLNAMQKEVDRLHTIERERKQCDNNSAFETVSNLTIGSLSTQLRSSVHIHPGCPAEIVDVNYTLFSAVNQNQKKSTVFVVIISAQSDRSAKQRRLVRRSWLKQIVSDMNPRDISAKFFVGRKSPEKLLTESVSNEISEYGDIVVVDVGDTYGGLIPKVRASLQWVVANHPSTYVAKFDDDCYVAAHNLLDELTQLPTERLYYGRMLAGGPIIREKNRRNAEPALPPGVNWFPPYASGAGYALSWDLVQTIAFPSVKRLDMVNEDGHLGIVLLPFDVRRHSSKKIYPYGVQEGARTGVCTKENDIVAIHYVKDKENHDCMDEIHENITNGKPICESRFCGPVDCNFSFPRPKNLGRCDRTEAAWETISETHCCEKNDQHIERIFVAKRMRSLDCCQQLCQETCGCVAIDYYRVTAWCNLYDAACKRPLKGSEGASSYRLVNVGNEQE